MPRQARDLVERGKGLGVPVGVHLHNTRNTGFANAYAALEAGAEVFESSVGGLGGCPFAPRATGNIATEDLVFLLHGEGVETGIDLDALIGVSEWLEGVLGRALPGQVYRAGASADLAFRASRRGGRWWARAPTSSSSSSPTSVRSRSSRTRLFPGSSPRGLSGR